MPPPVPAPGVKPPVADGWSGENTASVIGIGTSLMNTGTALLRDEARIAALNQVIAEQEAALLAIQGAGSARAEGFPLLQAMQAQLARERLAASIAERDALAARNLATLTALRAESTSLGVQIAALPGAGPSPGAPVASSVGAGTVVAGFAGATVLAGLVWWLATRKRASKRTWRR